MILLLLLHIQNNVMTTEYPLAMDVAQHAKLNQDGHAQDSLLSVTCVQTTLLRDQNYVMTDQMMGSGVKLGV